MKSKIAYKLYKKWFIKNFILFLISIGIFLYFVLLSNPTWLIYPSILFVFMTIGWGTTAYVGMKTNKI